MKRRNFLHTTTLTTSALMFSSLEVFALKNKPDIAMDNNFNLKVMATMWGYNGPWDEFCARVKKEGYDGIEVWWPEEQKVQDEMFKALEKNGLDVGFITGSEQSNYNDHFNSFKKMIDAAATNKIKKPLYINCHSGKDYFNYEQGKTFIDHTIALAKSSGVRISHETHRSRLLYAAPITRNYMETIPELRITFDVSHWCNVHESFLADQQETVDMTLKRVDHIHARIGHDQGPQVNDPRAPEWESAVKAHFDWWDKIAEMKKKKGETLTILTEFGPPTYMPTLPYTNQPLADQWDINFYMMQLLRKRYTPNP